MISRGELRGLRNFAAAILRSALSDASKGLDSPERLRQFADSDWCFQLCDVLGIAVTAYKRDLSKRISQNIDRSKPKRIQTHRLAGVLKNGKDTGTDKNKADRQVC